MHQNSVSSVCQKGHRMFYAQFTPAGSRFKFISYQLAFQKEKFIFMNLKIYVGTALRTIYTKICSARVSWMRPNIHIVFKLYCKTLLLPLKRDIGKVRVRFVGIGGFKGKGWLNSVIIRARAPVVREPFWNCSDSSSSSKYITFLRA